QAASYGFKGEFNVGRCYREDYVISKVIDYDDAVKFIHAALKHSNE
ncbi:13016_t:CDS:2, partial [Dentiscutata heterogama]